MPCEGAAGSPGAARAEPAPASGVFLAA